MHLYKFVFIKFFYSIILSFLILFSVLYIFSLIELLSDQYKIFDTLVIGVLNTIELLSTIPNILFVTSIIIFSINLKKTNELMIIRQYLGIVKIGIIFLIFIIIFTNLEMNKSYYKNLIGDLKQFYLKSNLKKEINQKVFFDFKDNTLTISKFENINIAKNTIGNISIYKFKDDEFQNAIFTDNSKITNRKIIMNDINIIYENKIDKSKKKNELLIKDLGEGFYNTNTISHKIESKSLKVRPSDLLTKVSLILSLMVYLVIFISRKSIQKSSHNGILIGLSFLVFIYSFVSSNIFLAQHNNIFHFLVALTFLIYLYKKIIND